MKWSWRIARLFGIDLYIHFTFFLLLAWVAVTQYMASGDPAEAVAGLVFVLVLFGIVVLHELGHALAARRYGIPTHDITLLPIGGVSRMERMPDDPRQELVVALAGPAVNVVIAGVLFLVLVQRGWLTTPGDVLHLGFLGLLFWVNVSLAVFNLLPAFPMDGGRVLRALLALKLDRVRATRIAASVGQIAALVFAIFGLLYNPLLILIALFIWFGAAQEAGMEQLRGALAGIPVRAAMITDFQTLRPEEPVPQAAEHVLAAFQQDFPGVEGERPVGLLTRKDLAAALGRPGPEALVGDVMRREVVTADPKEMLQNVLVRLQERGTLPVVEDGHLVGLLTADTLAQVLTTRERLRGAGGSDDGRSAGPPAGRPEPSPFDERSPAGGEPSYFGRPK
jgi:Zn-dependent protease/CBS domain-containing protein